MMDTFVQLLEALRDENIRVAIDDREEKQQKLESQLNKISYTLVLGDDEQQHHTVSVRKYAHDDNETMDIQAFIEKLKHEIESKALLV